ncbi:hypothetical protein BCR44DRAFT_1257709 [Catenaria anguillulae PL171]|uniref:Uncharacterized protein n=1 Tax=Catenaria anguillulae PL171 TaxID=765915 RepID=A0A1Y2HFU1_9FUNG|nr:hypothetical protein BCR44DRAFT_1257709 [Catenaria anguillulae PL171]
MSSANSAAALHGKPPSPGPPPAATPGSMTQADLRSALQSQLRASGVADELKAQLRAKIIHHLNGPAGLSSATPSRCAVTAASGAAPLSAAADLATNNLVHTVANALVADYLAAHDLNYTLSVYLPETTQAQPPSMDVAELQELLHLSFDGCNASRSLVSEIQKAATQSSSILEGLVRGIRILDVHTATQQTQTDSTDTERTLREYSQLVERERDEKRKALLDQARKHDLMVEDRVARELEQKLEAFRATELKRLQVEARESVLSKLEDAREAAERKHEAATDKLRNEIHELQTRMRARESTCTRDQDCADQGRCRACAAPSPATSQGR